MEKTFLQFKVQVVFSRQGKDIGDSCGVIVIAGARGNSYIIHVNVDSSTEESVLSYNGAKNVIYIVWKVAGELVRPKNMTVGS